MPSTGDAEIRLSSALPVSAAQAWERVTTPEGIDHELGPLLSMTMPPGLRGRSLADAQELVGLPLGRARLLLLGVLPVEHDEMTLVRVDAGRGFHERSSMRLLRRWEHERTVEPRGAAMCVVHDRLVLEPRRGVPLPVARRVTAALFAHRHRRLRGWAADVAA
ncbi:hypothetical protein [Nocardioides nanhaiensis]|uniref:SRPBCC family protein n=1 Tax=Nocardioides nanhaiensis TaxID=1476871 RepID=A0ABP8VXJ0_9ACTN